jgi:hypothetical protein
MRAILRLLPCKAGALQRKCGIQLDRIPGTRDAHVALHGYFRNPQHRVASACSQQQSGFLERFASPSDQ